MRSTQPKWSLLVSLSVLLAGSCSPPDAEVEPGERDPPPAAASRREVARPVPLPVDHPDATLPAPAAGTPGRPFDGACDGWAIGFRDPAGGPPRLRLHGAPQSAVYECRTGPLAEVASRPFAVCDGGDGGGAFHEPPLEREGSYRTEVRYRAGTELSRTAAVDYYAHHSLDGVACCSSALSDDQWFAAAREHVEPAEPFDERTRLLNPFIEIGGLRGRGDYPLEVLSLRRTFRLNRDRDLLLIRRTMISRRTRELTGREVCNGVVVAIPELSPRGSRPLHCGPSSQRPFRGGLEPPDCPRVYCTLTDCEEFADGCIEVTHTFQRGLGQDPWVVTMPRECPEPVIRLRPVECDAYVVNRRGDAVCLVEREGSIRAAAVLPEDERPLGLLVLKDRPEHYVFSAKSTVPTGLEEILYLPD